MHELVDKLQWWVCGHGNVFLRDVNMVRDLKKDEFISCFLSCISFTFNLCTTGWKISLYHGYTIMSNNNAWAVTCELNSASNTDSFSFLITMFWSDFITKWLLFMYVFKYERTLFCFHVLVMLGFKHLREWKLGVNKNDHNCDSRVASVQPLAHFPTLSAPFAIDEVSQFKSK